MGTEPRSARGGLAAAGVCLGVGLGGFVDGIVLHQILQWHHLLTNRADTPADTVAGLEANTLADGLFHVASWVFVVLGVILLWRARPVRGAGGGRRLLGWVLAGWGVFNLVEGIVDHHVLQIHHVRDDVADPLPWDLGFLAVSVVILGVGLVLALAGRAHDEPPDPANATVDVRAASEPTRTLSGRPPARGVRP